MSGRKFLKEVFMSKIKQLKNIEVLSLSLLEETNEILLKNYPLDSREYLEGKEKSIVERMII